jgi:hypothetical protein
MITLHFTDFAPHIGLARGLLNRIWMRNYSNTAFGCHSTCAGLSGSSKTGTGRRLLVYRHREVGASLLQAEQRGVVKLPAYLDGLFRPTHTPNLAYPIQ